MTGEDFESRLRRVEDWCLKHDERCSGRDERLVQAIESVKRSLEKESKSMKVTDARVDALKDEMAGMKVKLAFIAGLGAAGGGVVGSALFQAFIR